MQWALIIVLIVIIFFIFCKGAEHFTSQGKPAFVLFYAPWCGYCKTFMGTWAQFAGDTGARSNGQVRVYKVNGDEEKELASKHGVKGFPTIRYLPTGDLSGGSIEYTGNRTLEDLIRWRGTVLP